MIPKVSILCPSFNHEKYVSGFINSVLEQTYQDFELIIVDDCSTDNNVKIIETFVDPRIKLIKHDYNQGINATLNTAFSVSEGEYLIFIASDDSLCKEYIETTVNYFEQNPNIDVLYFDLQPMDENGTNRSDLQELFSHKTNDKYEALKNFFYGQSSMMSPGMAMKRKVFEKTLYPLDIGILQCQDTIMHIKIMLDFNITVEKNRLVRYRVPCIKNGISYNNFANIQRSSLEIVALMDSFLKISDTNILKKIFGDKANQFGEPIKQTIPYILARLALESDDDRRKKWGYKTIMHFIADKDNFQLLHEKYNFNFSQYINLVNGFSGKSLDKKVKKYRQIVKIMATIIFLLVIIIVTMYIGG